MEPQRLPPRVASPICDKDSLVGSSTQPRFNTAGEDSEVSDHSLPCGTSTVHLSADSIEQQEENNPFDATGKRSS